MTTPARLLAVSVMLAACAARAARQEPDTVRCHRGQWAADVSLGYGFTGAGALRFTSPTRAGVVDLSGRYDRGLSRYQDTIRQQRYEDFQGNVRLRLGRRGYRLVGSRVYRILTAGVTGNYGHDANNSTPQRIEHSIGLGIFAELGAQWMVASTWGLGARGARGWDRSEGRCGG